MGKTYKQIIQRELPRLQKEKEELNQVIKLLRQQLAEQNILDPVIFVKKVEANEMLLNAVKEIYHCCNPATQAWEIADSVLRRLS